MLLSPLTQRLFEKIVCEWEKYPKKFKKLGGHMEKHCFVCGKELGQFSFVVVIEAGEEVAIVGVCEDCGYTIAKERGC